jgi:hypothetical protein
MSDAKDAANMRHQPVRAALQGVPDRQEQVFLEGEESRGRQGRSRNHTQEVEGGAGDESLSGDEVEEVRLPRGKS